MDTKATNQLSQYFGEMDKKNSRSKQLNTIFEQIHPHKDGDALVTAKDSKTQPATRQAEAVH